MEVYVALGLFAGLAGALDLTYVYFRGERMPPKAKQLRIGGAFLMFALAALLLLRIIKIG